MSTTIDKLERAQMRRLPAVAPGDRVRVHFQVVEGARRRTQVFEGVVIKRQGHGVRETFTVRKQSFGVGVERTFPFHSPKIERIEVAARGDVRRAKLYYLRERVGKRARVRERRDLTPEEAVERELLYGPAQDAEAGTQDAEAGTQRAEDAEAAAQDAEAGAQDTEAGTQDAEAGAQDTEAAAQDAEAGTQRAEDAEAGAQDAEAGAQDAEAGAQDAEAEPAAGDAERG